MQYLFLNIMGVNKCGIKSNSFVTVTICQLYLTYLAIIKREWSRFSYIRLHLNVFPLQRKCDFGPM